MAYLNIETFKQFIGVPVATTTNDQLFSLILTGIEQAIDTWCGWPLALATVTEYYSGDGTPDLRLDRYPLNAAADVAGVWEDWNGNWGQTSGSFNATTSLLTLGTDYAVKVEGVSKRPVLVRLFAVWPYLNRYPVGRLSPLLGESQGTVKVTYSAGFTTQAPADVISAAYAEAAAIWASRRIGYGLQTSAGLDGYNIAFTPFPRSRAADSCPFMTERLCKATGVYRRIPVAR